MAKKRYNGLSVSQKAELWQRWKDGQSLSEIGSALNKHPASVYTIVAANGGIVPVQPCRSRLALRLEEREEISRGLAANYSIREIALQLGRPASTVSREIERNGGRIKYRAETADRRAWSCAKRPKQCLLASSQRLQRTVAEKLQLNWSPEQIAGWLKLTYPENDSMQVSHETIYRSLFIQARGVLKKELIEHLRSRRPTRRSKHLSSQPRGQIIDAVSIRERPAQIEERAVPGHWEGDLITGSGNTHIATLVERQSRFTMLVKVEGKDTVSVVSALSKQVRKLPEKLRKSLTWDRGMELANHKEFTLATNVDVYFCDPQSPWQRGTNENTNRLLRQYFPKGTALSGYSQRDLDKIALELNRRPRKTLGFHTPADKLESLLQ